MFKIFVFLLASAQNQAATDPQRAAADRQRDQTLAAMAASIDKQKISVHLQKERHATPAAAPAKPEEFFVFESEIPQPSMVADCEPLSPLQVQLLSDKAAKANGISGDLIRAVMKQESAFRPCAVSPAGAVGLMQLMPDTAMELGVADSTDPESNVLGGAKYLRKLVDRYNGDLNLVLGAYNAGPANVDKANGVPNFPETLNYVDSIMRGLSSTGDAHPGIPAVKPTASN